MKTPTYMATASIVGLMILTIVLFLGHIILFFGKDVWPYYYQWFPTSTEQIIAFLSIPAGAIVVSTARKTLL